LAPATSTWHVREHVWLPQESATPQGFPQGFVPSFEPQATVRFSWNPGHERVTSSGHGGQTKAHFPSSGSLESGAGQIWPALRSLFRVGFAGLSRWHGRWQTWPHFSRGIPQGSGQGGQGPKWQGCVWKDSEALPLAFSVVLAFWGFCGRQPVRICNLVCRHVGGAVQGRLHSGGLSLAPHGYTASSAPQLHFMRVFRGQGRHAPLWQGARHLWLPHGRRRLQVSVHV
jgi:hypothetical protein